jgi:TonB family protein
MKINLLLLFSFLYFTAIAQKTEAYYNHNWEPCSPEAARYYSIMEKTDSGWFRKDYFVSSKTLQMQALFEDEACKTQNGYCQFYYVNGRPSMIGRMIHGKQEGICMSFYSNGMMSDSALFHDGLVVDKRFKWHRNGYISDSFSRVDDKTEVQVGWYDDGTPSYAGYLVNGKQNGKWKYFHHNGQLSSVEVYANGRLISAEYSDEKGQPLTDTSNANRKVSFKGGIEGWKKYVEKNLYWPADLQFSKEASVTVEIDFTINEDGKPEDVEVSLPFHPNFDEIALKIIKNSPAWIPAIEHNRKVRTSLRQPVTFAQSIN